MRKYRALTEHLENQSVSEVPMTFDDVAAIVGMEHLPKSAVFYRMWWSNNTKNHVHAKAWVDAGFETAQVDMEKKTVVFRKVTKQPKATGMSDAQRDFEPAPQVPKQAGHHPLIGWMKGTFTIAPDWDITKPALDPEELAEWEANLDRMADELGWPQADTEK